MCPETNTLHLILQAIIIDGFQRMRPAADVKTNAEAAAQAFRAGLAAFTAPREALVGGSTKATLDVSRHYGGAAGYSFGQVGDASGATAGPLAGVQSPMAASAEISARSCSALAAIAALHRLAAAAAQIPIKPAGDQNER